MPCTVSVHLIVVLGLGILIGKNQRQYQIVYITSHVLLMVIYLFRFNWWSKSSYFLDYHILFLLFFIKILYIFRRLHQHVKASVVAHLVKFNRWIPGSTPGCGMFFLIIIFLFFKRILYINKCLHQNMKISVVEHWLNSILNSAFNSRPEKFSSKFQVRVLSVLNEHDIQFYFILINFCILNFRCTQNPQQNWLKKMRELCLISYLLGLNKNCLIFTIYLN